MISRRFARVLAAVLVLAWSWDVTSAADSQSTLAGYLLVASPDMPDPRFAETVVYMCRHDAEGAFGLVLNRPAGDMALSRVLESFKVEKAEEAQGMIEVRRGGPVEGNRGYVMHSDDFKAHGSICRDDGVAVSASIDVLRAMAAGQGPERAILFLGYAGWAPGQLDDEVAQDGWVVVPSDAKMLLDRDVTGLWRRAMTRRGIDL